MKLKELLFYERQSSFIQLEPPRRHLITRFKAVFDSCQSHLTLGKPSHQVESFFIVSSMMLVEPGFVWKYFAILATNVNHSMHLSMTKFM